MSVRSGRGMGRSYHESPFRRKDRPLVWAHRGASADALENTLAAFDEAERQGAEGIECDLRLSRDGTPVVFHDEDLRRLGGLPVAVRDLDAADLLAQGLRDRPGGREGRIPTLEEAVRSTSARMLWNLELKVDRYAEAEPLVRAVVDWARRAGVEERLLISSFHPLALLHCRVLAPELATAYLWEADSFHPLWHGFWLRVTSSGAVHPPLRAVRAEAVRRWQRLGLCVNTWVCNEPEQMRRLAEAGVDGIITDLPRVAVQALEGSWTSTGWKSAASQETRR